MLGLICYWFCGFSFGLLRWLGVFCWFFFLSFKVKKHTLVLLIVLSKMLDSSVLSVFDLQLGSVQGTERADFFLPKASPCSRCLCSQKQVNKEFTRITDSVCIFEELFAAW